MYILFAGLGLLGGFELGFDSGDLVLISPVVSKLCNICKDVAIFCISVKSGSYYLML